jgi:hypothetical protein
MFLLLAKRSPSEPCLFRFAPDAIACHRAIAQQRLEKLLRRI